MNKETKGSFIITPAETNIVKPNGHKFAIGETRELLELATYPEYNGDKVEITNFRKDGRFGKAYYVKGRINERLNWIYEYRLK